MAVPPDSGHNIGRPSSEASASPYGMGSGKIPIDGGDIVHEYSLVQGRVPDCQCTEGSGVHNISGEMRVVVVLPGRRFHHPEQLSLAGPRQVNPPLPAGGRTGYLLRRAVAARYAGMCCRERAKVPWWQV